MEDETEISQTTPHLVAHKMNLIALTMIIVAFASGFMLGQKKSDNKIGLSPTPSVIPTFEVIPLSPTLFALPTLNPSPTVIINKQDNKALQECKDLVNSKAMEGYEDFCERWKSQNNSNGCPGLDLVDEVYKECYDKYGRP